MAQTSSYITELDAAHDAALGTIRYLRSKIVGALHTSANPDESLREGLSVTEGYNFLDRVKDENRVKAHLAIRRSEDEHAAETSRKE